ncbi:hypothetical protein H0H93_009946 [Arthromyces matolae]|nr:hypothetical protein H0H93_009946 [Arthromyces matolae]
MSGLVDLPSSPRPSSRSSGTARGDHSTRVSYPMYSGNDKQASKRFSTFTTLMSPSSNPSSLQQPSRILFYHSHEPYYGFTNFSAHPVVYKGKKYPTSEHLFQSFKFQEHKPDLAEHIRTCSERPSVAFSEARRFQPEVRRDWKDVNIEMMDIALQLKFEQHDDLREELLGTGNLTLIENSDKDAFWGIGADWKGRNELGKGLERLRAKFRSSGFPASSPSLLSRTSTDSSLRSESQIQAQNVLSPRPSPGVHVRFPTPEKTLPSPPPNLNTRSPRPPPHSPFPVPSISLNQSQGHSVLLSPNQDVGFPLLQPTTYNTQATQTHLVEQNKPSSEQSSPMVGNDMMADLMVVDSPPSTATATSDIANICRIPECEKPVYYDGKVQSEYCSQQHRECVLVSRESVLVFILLTLSCYLETQ